MTIKCCKELAIGWIEAWKKMDMNWLVGHLDDDFIHTSPFGVLEGKEFYLKTVEPMARKSVQKLEIISVIANNNEAAIWFNNISANGTVPSCDWLKVENGKITEIQSFYDSVKIREILNPEEQNQLGT